MKFEIISQKFHKNYYSLAFTIAADIHSVVDIHAEHLRNLLSFSCSNNQKCKQCHRCLQSRNRRRRRRRHPHGRRRLQRQQKSQIKFPYRASIDSAIKSRVNKITELHSYRLLLRCINGHHVKLRVLNYSDDGLMNVRLQNEDCGGL